MCLELKGLDCAGNLSLVVISTYMILATQEESVARARKSDEGQAKAEEETSNFRRRNREVGIIKLWQQ